MIQKGVLSQPSNRSIIIVTNHVLRTLKDGCSREHANESRIKTNNSERMRLSNFGCSLAAIRAAMGELLR